MQYIHISTARKIMESPERFSLKVWKKDGSIMECNDVISLRYDFYRGTRRIKFPNGQIRQIRDVLIFEINGMEVGL